MSNAMLLSQYVNQVSRGKTIYQGVASVSAIVGSTDATILINPVGNPTSYDVLIQNLKLHTNQVNVPLSSLTPNTNYDITIISNYSSGQTYVSSLSIKTLNEDSVSNIIISEDTQKYFTEVPSSRSWNIRFPPSIGTPSSYTLSFSGVTQSASPNTNIVVNPISNNTNYTVSVTTFYSSGKSYKKSTTLTSLNEMPIDYTFTYNGTSASFIYTPVPTVSYILYANNVMYSGNLTDLTPGTYYHGYIDSIYPSQNIYRSKEFHFTTLLEGPISNVQITLTNNSITMSFTPSPGNIKNVILLNRALVESSTNQITIRNLQEDTFYEVTVRSFYENHTYDYVKTVKTLIEGPVHDISCSDIRGTFLTLSWQPYPNSVPIAYTITNNQDQMQLFSSRTTYTLPQNSLAPNTEYIFKIIATYSSNTYSSDSSSVRTLNEGPFPPITIEAYGDRAIIQCSETTNPYALATYTINSTTTELSDFSGIVLSNLQYNKTYDLQISTTYGTRTYSKSTIFTTLNEYALSFSTVITGTSITLIAVVTGDRLVLTYRTTYGSQKTLDISGDALSNLMLTDLTPNTHYLLTIDNYFSTRKYSSSISFTTRNEGPLKNLSLKVYDTKVSLNFDIYSDEVLYYQLSGDKKLLTDKTITGLSIGTRYTLTIYSKFSENEYSVSRSFQTLMEGIVVPNVVNNSNGIITLDGNIVGDTYSGNVVFGNSDYQLTEFPIDLSGSGNTTLTTNINYTNSLSTNDIQYISQTFSKSQGTTFVSTFNENNYISNGFLPETTETKKGFYTSLPREWPLSISVFVTDTSLNQSILGIPTYALLYFPIFNNEAKWSKLSRVIPYLFCGPNILYFSVATSSVPVSFQVQLTSENPYRTSIITVTNTNWNLIQLKLDIAKSLKNVTVTISRTGYEQSSLLIGNLVFKTCLPFLQEPVLTFADGFHVPSSLENSSWNNLVASNITISGWFYAHDNCVSSEKKIFTVGYNTSFPSIVVDENNRLYGHDISFGAPTFFTITSYNQQLSLYLNGKVVSNSGSITEPLLNDPILFQGEDFLISQIHFYDHVLQDIPSLYDPLFLKIENIFSLSSDNIIHMDMSENINLYWNSVCYTRKLDYTTLSADISFSVPGSVSFWFQSTAIFSLGDTIFSISGGLLCMNGLPTFIRPVNWNHITYTNSSLYWNGYLLSSFEMDPVLTLQHGSFGEVFRNGSLSSSQVLANYYQMYKLRNVDLSGNLFSLQVTCPSFETTPLVLWKLVLPETTISGNFIHDNAGSSISYLLDSKILNTYRANQNTAGNLILTDFGTSIPVSLDGPYIQTVSNVDEGSSITIQLQNNGTDVSYSISGICDLLINDTKAINSYQGSIRDSITISVTKDFRTNDSKYFDFSIDTLGIASRVAINDTSKAFSLTSSASSAEIDNTFTITWEGDPAGTHYTISGVSSEDISVPLNGDIPPNNKFAIKVNTPLTKQFTIFATENSDISVNVIFNDIAHHLSVNKNPPQINEGDDFVISVIAPYATTAGTILPYTVSGVHPYNIDYGDLIGNVEIQQIGIDTLYGVRVPRMGGNVNFKIINNHLTEGQLTFLFSLMNKSLPVYIIDTSITPTYNLYSSSSSVNTDDSAFQIILATTGLDPTNIPYVISGVNETDISFASMSGYLQVTNGIAFQTFYASKNHQPTEVAKVFTLTINFKDPYFYEVDGSVRSLSTAVQFVDTNKPTIYSFVTNLASKYIYQNSKSFQIGLSGENVKVGNAFITYRYTGCSEEDISGIQNVGTLDLFNKKTVTVLTTSPRTLVFTSQSNPNMVPFSIGLNYTAANPDLEVNFGTNVQVTLYGYLQDCTYTYGDSSGTIYADPDGFQRTTSFSLKAAILEITDGVGFKVYPK